MLISKKLNEEDCYEKYRIQTIKDDGQLQNHEKVLIK